MMFDSARDLMLGLTLAFGEERRLAGVRVRMALVEQERQAHVWEQLGASLDSFARFSPHALARALAIPNGLVVLPATRSFAGWHSRQECVIVSSESVADGSSFVGTLAHFLAHASLASRGIRFDESRRPEYVSVCWRAAASMLRPVPGMSDLAEAYELSAASIRQQSAQWLSNEALWDRNREAFMTESRGKGIPDCVATAAWGLLRRASA